MKRPAGLLGAAALLATVPAAVQAAPFNVTGGWFRALPGNLPAGGYFTAENTTPRPVDITGARSDACGMIMIHQSTSKGGMSGMDMMNRVTVPAGGRVDFSPGGYHLMCTNPTPKLKIGARVPVTIHLSDGTAVAAAFQVRGASGK
ncbi:MAG TPA: copper chaperone PCu(A)C [Rhizomicrobium sp.]|nr:copper chaperone PCu(A)C [Rhizomicrobium sp.]